MIKSDCFKPCSEIPQIIYMSCLRRRIVKEVDFDLGYCIFDKVVIYGIVFFVIKGSIYIFKRNLFIFFIF